MKDKNLLIIDDNLESRKMSYEALCNNLKTRIKNKYQITFTYLSRWSELEDVLSNNNFDGIISDVFLESETNNLDWPDSITIKDVLPFLLDYKHIPIFVVSSQWNKGDDRILNEMIQTPQVESLLIWNSIAAEEKGPAYASAILQKKLFPQTRYTILSEEPAITILHCSDFHFESINESELKTRLNSLYIILNEKIDFKKNGKLHFLCMGGDFINQGTIKNFELLKNIFINFVARVSSEFLPTTVFTVPGNHDYNRDVAKLLINNISLKESIFFPYWDFVKTISPDMEKLLLAPSSMWVFKETAPLGFYFYGINTELQNESEYTDIDNYSQYNGYINKDDLLSLQKINNEMDSLYDNNGIVSIGLMHRTVDMNIESNQMSQENNVPIKYIRNNNDIKNTMKLPNSSPVFLCGDIHASTSSTALGGNSHGILSSSPSFMGEPANKLGEGFNLITLTKTNNKIQKIKIENFTYNEEIMRFEENTSRTTEFKRGKKHFNQI